ncbi:hypothetical protein M493_16600 [Geobacillus genomosp. 3]|uniref:Uncharacterized protein n=1 Tax=Geobacillus genomosp. 3 TaxID=1921421 RepID=S5Z9K2_GEOG3|nr:hypothetical protein M493_16600 [Geobacillus genomosp. 3]
MNPAGRPCRMKAWAAGFVEQIDRRISLSFGMSAAYQDAYIFLEQALFDQRFKKTD